MTAEGKPMSTPAGQAASEAAKGRARHSEAYREARDEYAAIRALRERNWIAAHIRERRYELDLTQQEVAEGHAPGRGVADGHLVSLDRCST